MLEAISRFTRMEEFFWARPIPGAAMVAILVGILLLSAFIYRRSWGLRPWLRFGLAAARVIVLALIVATLFEPTAVVRETHTQVRGLPVLLDVSESMGMKDQRKRPEDVMEAVAALGPGPLEAVAEANRSDSALDAGQRQAVAAASRLDLAVSLLTRSGLPLFDALGR
jgi:hypothetical protein